MSLVLLADIKTYLGIPTLDTTQDAFLTQQEGLISDTVEAYCGRKFLIPGTSYVQSFYVEDYFRGISDLHLLNFPVSEITEVKDGDTIYTVGGGVLDEVRPNFSVGNIFRRRGFFIYGDIVQVTYKAGFAALPSPVASVIMSLVEERYNKKQSGVPLNFGSDVQSISIPGTISVAFDYSLQANDRKTKFGTILGNYLNVLDFYRSERVIVGQGKLSYVV